MKTSFEIWTERLAALRGVPSLRDGELAALLGVHRNRIADFKRGFTTHNPPNAAQPDFAHGSPWPLYLQELKRGLRKFQTIHEQAGPMYL